MECLSTEQSSTCTPAGAGQNYNETTPSSKYKYSSHHLSKTKQSKIESSMGCTPKTSRFGTGSICNESSSNNEFSITNPFEAHITVDSFLQPSFSPSVFGNNSKNDSDKKSENFWSIDQIAVLKPVDIDLSHLHKQEEFVLFDPEMEKKAQQAIEKFFNSHTNMASPWSDEKPKPYLALISPSPGPLKKRPLLKSSATHSSSSASSMSSQVNLHRINMKSRLKAQNDSNKTEDTENIPQNTDEKYVTTSTQTVLTLPTNFDLEKILSEYFTYHQEERKISENQTEMLSNSSLRRKLFFPDGEMINNDSMKSGEGDKAEDPQPLDDDDDDEKDGDSCFIFPTHEMIQANLITPIKQTSMNMSQGSIVTPTSAAYKQVPKTPSTCHSHFSSSPVSGGNEFTYDIRTPCSNIFDDSPRFSSGGRKVRLKGHSVDDSELVSPGLSPVAECKENVFQHKEKFTEDDNTELGDSSTQNLAKRRSVLMDSPPLSPIEPIKFNKNAAVHSSSVFIKPSQNSTQLPQINLSSPIDSSSCIKGRRKKSNRNNLSPQARVIKSLHQLDNESESNELLEENKMQNENSSLISCDEFDKLKTENQPNSGTYESEMNKANILLCSKPNSLDIKPLPQITETKENEKKVASAFFPPPSICSSAIFTPEEMPSSEGTALMDNANIDFTRSVVLDTASRHQTMCESIPMQYESHIVDKCAINTSTMPNLYTLNESINHTTPYSTEAVSKGFKRTSTKASHLNEISDIHSINPSLILDAPCENMSLDISFDENKENLSEIKLCTKNKLIDNIKCDGPMDVSMRGPSPIISEGNSECLSTKPNNAHSADSGYTTVQSNP